MKNKRPFLIFLILTLAFCPSYLYAELPTGEKIDDPASASFDRSIPNILTVNSNVGNLNINWDSFSIGAGETVNFYSNLQNVNPSFMNYVVGSSASRIDGVINSPGQVGLVNPNGVFIGSTAQINVGSLLVSTLDISSVEGRNYVFFKQSGKNSFIINEGYISAMPGGYVVLLSQAIENRGTILAPLGTIALAVGEKITVGLDDMSHISVAVGVGTNPDANVFDSAIKNTGTISANGGAIILNAKVLNSVLKYAINNSGTIEAKALVNNNGTIELVAEGSDIINTGLINTKVLTEEAYSFTTTGIITGGSAYYKNADGAANIGGSIGSDQFDVDDLNVIGDIILTADNLTFSAGTDGSGSFISNGWSIDSDSGFDYSLTINVASDSTLGAIGNTDVLGSLSLGRSAGVGTPNFTMGGDITLSLSGNLAIGADTALTAGSYAITVGGDWTNSGTFTAGSGTVTFNGDNPGNMITSGGSSFNNVVIDDGFAGADWTLADALSTTGDLTITSGTLDDGGNTITISGNFANNDTFAAAGTIEFIDNTKTSTISGSNTFFDFISTTAGKNITFEAGATQTITGTLTLTGTSGAGNLIVLRSSVDGTQWDIDPQGARSVSKVDVKDSNNVNGTAISAPNSKDSGNNTNWDLVDHFVITGSAGQIAGTANALTITVIDGVGGTALSSSEDKSLTFSGANLIGGNTPAVTDNSGTAVNFGTATTITFTNGVSTAGGSMVLYKVETANVTATEGGITTPAALSVSVTPAAADNLAFIQQPTNADFGTIITPAMTVEVRDQFENRLTSDDATSITIAIGTNPGGGVMVGTTSRTASSGVGTFDDTSVSLPGTGYTLTISSAGLTGATANTFNVTGTVPIVAATDTGIKGVIQSQLSNSEIVRPAPLTTQGIAQFVINTMDSVDPVFFYQPLTPVDTAAFDALAVDENAYQFINGSLNLVGHEGLLPMLDEVKINNPSKI